MAFNLLSSLKEGTKFSPQGRVTQAGYKIGKKIALGTGAVFGMVMLYLLKLGAAVAKGAIIGASVGAGVGGVAGGVIGFQIGVALAPFTLGLSIPVFTVIGATTGAFVGATVGAITGGAIAYALSTGSLTAASVGVGAGVGGTIGAVAGYAAGAAAWGLVVGACAAVTGGACAALAVFTPAAGAIGSIAGAYVGTAIGSAVGYGFGEYVANPVKNFFANSQVSLKHGVDATESAVGNSANYIWNSIKGGLGGFGHTAMGWVSAGWNGAIGLGGSLLGGAASGISAVIDGLGWGFGSIAGTIAKIGVFGTAGATVVTGFLVINGAAATLSDPRSEYDVQPPAGENEFYTITKTAAPTSMETPGADITFTITLTAKNKNLTEVHITDTVRVQGDTNFEITMDKGGTPINNILSSECSTSIPAKGNCSVTFTIATHSGFNNHVVLNTANARATPEGEAEVKDTANASVIIGTPPAKCPQGWPTKTGLISQGPEGRTSHGDPPVSYGSGGLEAIDIAVFHQPVYSTIDGTVSDIYKGGGAEDYRVAVIPDGCTNLEVVYFWHLLSVNPSLSENGRIKFGDLVGTSGLQGTGYHTHYQFNNAFDRDPLITNYLPKSFPRACDGESACGVTIP